MRPGNCNASTKKKMSYRSEIWRASRQRCCLDARQILKRCQSPGFGTSYDNPTPTPNPARTAYLIKTCLVTVNIIQCDELTYMNMVNPFILCHRKCSRCFFYIFVIFNSLLTVRVPCVSLHHWFGLGSFKLRDQLQSDWHQQGNTTADPVKLEIPQAISKLES